MSILGYSTCMTSDTNDNPYCVEDSRYYCKLLILFVD